MTTIPAPAVAQNGTGPLAPYHDKGAWWQVRMGLIGSTDVAAILGKDEYDPAAQKVWDRVVLGIAEENIEKSGDVRRGQKFEPVAADTLEERLRVRLRRHPMQYHAELPFLVADVDRLIVSMTPEEWAASGLAAMADYQEGPGAAEIKVPRVANFYKMKEEGLSLQHIVQMQVHLAVTGWRWGVFVFYTPEYDDLIAFVVLRDDEFIALMERHVALWWENHILGQVRPEKPAPSPARWPKKVPGEATNRDDDEWAAAAGYVVQAEYEFEQARIRKEAAAANIEAILTEEDQFVVGGGIRVKRYSTTSQRRFDAKAFKAAVLLAQKEGDTEALLALNPDDDAFYYQTNPSDKIDIAVTAKREEEVPA